MPPLEQVLRKRRLLITGATGFLGKVLLAILLEHHPELDRIYLLIRGDRRSSLNRLRREILDSAALAPLRERLGTRFDQYVEGKVAVIAGDITEPGLAADGAGMPRTGSIDAVIHCAGLVNFEASLAKAIAINADGVSNVVEFCRTHGAALLHVSTCYAAGVADGQRYEDDLPTDWCPNGRRNFNLRRELRDAQAAIDRVEAESHDESHLAEFHLGAAGDRESDAAGDHHDRADHHDRSIEARRKSWVEDRLKAIGRRRALSWGWPNTYSYTKSLGEQIVMTARGAVAATVVRPSVIESALCDPLPGWNQGVNTSAPLTYLAGRGYRFYPARGDLVLDVIPVDLAAHAIVPILAALLLGRHQPIYQLCTSDVNPLPMRRLVELTALSNRREHRRRGGPMGKLAPHLEAVVVSHRTYEMFSSTLPAMLKQAAALARTVMGEESAPARKFEDRIAKLADNTAMARSLVEVYRPYIQDLVYTFHGKNIRALYATLEPADAARHPYHPEKIDWARYWIDVHLPGLRRHIFGQLELHTRARPRGVPRHRTLIEMLDSAAHRFGAAPALEARELAGQRTPISYRELRDRAHRGGLMLGGRAIKPGDRVLLIAENSPDWVIAYFAILYAGAVAVPLDHLIAPDELAAIGRIAAPRAALISSACRKRLGKAVRTAAPGAVEIEIGELQRPFVLRTAPGAPVAAERKTLASIVFTSGTTGTPKGVMLSHGNFTAEVAMLARVFALGADDTVLSILPLHHTLEFTCGLLLPIASGARIVYPLGIDAANLSRTLADVRPTALIGVPALWEAVHRRIVDEVEGRGPLFAAAFDRLRNLNRRLDRDYHVNFGAMLFRPAHNALGGHLRLAVSGGAALPQRVATFFHDLGIKLLEGYGLTEAAPVLSVARPDEPLIAGSVGQPLGKLEVRIDSPADAGGIGEIIARGPNVMSGYYRNPAATAEVLKDGWLHTGDLGRFDDAGRLYIVGRAKDVIVDAGGNNIYIDEIEQAYGHSHFIKEIAVAGLTIGAGEQVAALVVPAYARGESRRTIEDRVRAHFAIVGAGLNPHSRVRILRFSETELPRTRTRKIKRAEVAARLREILDRPLDNRGGEAAVTGDEIVPWLAQALAQVAIGTVPIGTGTRLIEDLGLDSLALAELAEQIAVKAGRELTADELSAAATVGDLQRLAGDGTVRPRLPSYARFAEPFTVELPAPLRRIGEFALRRSIGAAFDSWLKPRVMGRGNIPANRNVIVVANHASHLDFGLIAYALGTAGRDLVVLAAKDYFFKTPLRRFVARNFTHLLAIDRERSQLDSLDGALAELAAGRSVLMFPEGTRSPDGAIHEFKSGAGFLAMQSRCDVLPIHIRGSFEVLGKGALVPRHAPVEVRIGRVIGAAELLDVAQGTTGAAAYRRLAEHLRAAIVELAGDRPRAARRSLATQANVHDPKHAAAIAAGAADGAAIEHATDHSDDHVIDHAAEAPPRHRTPHAAKGAEG
ncbi:MAG: AMP-binding protein [Candidatus Binataceae bacterium]|nr:AMP-binding protein [Candidatus Binataceae bacterium]